MTGFHWSEKSKSRLAAVDPRLKAVFDKAISLDVIDISILEGYRNEERQTELYETGKSQVEFPNSKHNAYPSRAVDAISYPFKQADWSNTAKFAMFAGFIIGVGASMGVTIRAGIDWNGNFDPTDNWIDGPHFELVED